MEFHSLLISLLLVFFPQEVQGAYKQINETCVAGTNTCVHATLSLACDPVAAVCLIQAGQVCSADGYANLCVSGAACTDGTCTCGTAYTKNDNSGLCEVSTALYGADCSTLACETGSNLECVSNKYCVCLADFRLDIDTGKCVQIPAATLGHTCVSDDNCDSTMTCTDVTGSQKCVCAAGKTGIPGISCETVESTKIGAACTVGDQTATCGTHAACINGFCECDAHFYGVIGGDCSPVLGKLGGACKGTDCDDLHAECSSDTSTPPNTCVCEVNYLESAGVCEVRDYKQINEACVVGSADTCVHETLLLACDPVAAVCLIQAGQGCSADGYANLCVSGAACTGGKCTCGTAYTKNADSGLCVVATALHGGVCSEISGSILPCVADSNLQCVNNICVCDVDNKLEITTGKCEAISDKTFGHSCVFTDTPSCDATTTCEGDAGSEMCVCKAGTTGTPGNSCEDVASNKVSAACNTDGTAGTVIPCGTNAACSSGFCECNPNFYGVTGGDCSPAVGKLGGICKGTACDDLNAVCLEGVCMIQAGHGCSADGSANLCVSGAACTSNNLCTCGTAYNKHASGLCELKAEQAEIDCTTTGITCVDNSVCDTDSTRCLCSDGFAATTDGICKLKAEQAEKDCTTTGITCVDNSVCDTVSTRCLCSDGFAATTDGICLINAGQSCKDNEDKCTTGAKCHTTSKTCVCDGAYSLSSDGTSCLLKAKQAGIDCTTTGITCVDNSACDTASTKQCLCSKGFQATIDGICILKAEQAGIDCTTTGITCVDNSACDTASTKQCLCNEGFQATTDGVCDIDAKKFGGSCTADTANTKGTCDDANALCSAITDGTCGCKTGYTGTDGAGCAVSSSKVGGSCETTTANTTGSCDDENALCSAVTGGTCTCKTGYNGTDGAGCVKEVQIDGACTELDMCTPVDTLVCDPYKSICVIREGADCETKITSCPTGASCSSGTNRCKCGTGYVEEGGACSRTVTTVGVACTGADKCSGDNGVEMSCDTLAGRCLIKAGQSCKNNEDKCTTGAKCHTTSKTCVCDGAYSLSSDEISCQAAERKVGGECNAGSSCFDLNAECKDGLCLCKTGFKVKASDATCERSGVEKMMASVLCLVMAFLLGRLL